MNHKLSVLIPCYNDESTINNVCNSLVNQRKIPDQIVFVDDCSNDKTLDLINEFILNYSNIDIEIFQNEKNLGIYMNLKKNMNKLKYDIVFLGSANDLVYFDFFYDALKAFNSNKNIKLFFGGFEAKLGNRILYKKFLQNYTDSSLIKSKDYLKKVLLTNELGVSFSPSTIYDKKTLLSNFFIENLYSYHDSFTNNLIGLKHDTYYSHKIHSSWEYSKSSYSQKNNFKNFLIYINVVKLILFTKNIHLFKVKYTLKWILIFPLKIIYNIFFPYYKRIPKE